MKILVTGFEPFGEDSVNASLEAVSMLPIVIDGAFIVKQEVPVVFLKSISTLVKAIEEQEPDAVICVGMATGRPDITPELVAINLMNAAQEDNAGKKPLEKPIASDGPAAYFSTLPCNKMITAIKEAGLPASLSYSAGTFVCNNLFYGMMHYLKHRGNDIVGGFIHVPCLPAIAARCDTPTPSMTAENIEKALEAAISAVVATLKR